MSKVYYLIAAVLLIGWFLGFFFYDIFYEIHILLILAALSIVRKLMVDEEDKIHNT